MTVQSVMSGAKPHQNDLLLPGQRKHQWGYPKAMMMMATTVVIVDPATVGLQWLPFQAPGVLGLTLRLIGLVSVNSFWVRKKI